MKPTAASCPSCSSIVFTGTVSPLVSLVGTWVAHLTSGSSQKGTWQVGSTWNGVEHPTKGGGAATGTVSFSGVIETPTGTVSGQVRWQGNDLSIGPFTGTLKGSALNLKWQGEDMSYGGAPFTVYFKGKVSTALGGMSGTWNETYNSQLYAGVFQLTRSGASAAI